MATTIKITALQDIGANLGNTSLFPVVDMAGTPTTEKVSMANVANFVLNYGPAAEATIASKVSNNAQPNITSVGTLTNLAVTGNVVAGNVYANTNIIQGLLLGGTLIANSNAQPNITSLGTLVSLSVTGNVLGNNFSSNGNVVANNVTANTLLTVANITSNGTANLTTVNVSGNLSAGNANLGNAVTANFFIGDGGLLTNVAGGGSYSNNNVANYLPNYTGNINGDYLTLTHDANANVVYGNFIYGDGSNLTNVSATVAGTVTTNAQPNITSVGNLSGLTMSGNIIPSANVTYNLGNNTNRWNNLYLSGNTIVLGDAVLTANANALVVTTPGGGNFVLQGNANTTFGNIVSINTDGNASNILYGNGVFAASPSVSLTGDGGNLSNINGANVSGTVANANLSQLLNVSDVSNNFSYHVVLSAGSGDKSLHIDADDNLQYNPNSGLLTAVRVDAQNFVGNLYYSNGYQVANVNGIGNIATINLNSNGQTWLAGNGTFANIAIPSVGNIATINLNSNGQTWLAGNGVFANIAIPSVGNIANINLNGNANSVLAGDGNWVAQGVGGTPAGSNNQVQFNSNGAFGASGNCTFTDTVGGGTVTVGNELNLLGNGTIGTSNNNLNIQPAGNLVVTASAYNWTFSTDGLLTLPEGAIIDTLGNNFEVRAIENVNLEANAVVNIYTDGSGNAWQWQFGDDGNLILAGGNSVIQSIANSSLDPTLPNVSTMVLTPDANYNSQVLVLDPTAPGHIHLRAFASSNIDEPNANIFLGGEDTAFEITSGSNNKALIHSNNFTWTFGNDGNLQVAGDVFANTGASPAPALYGFSSLQVYDQINVAGVVLTNTELSNIVVWTTAPVSNTSNGVAGQAAYDSGGNLYICVSANTWSKFTGTTSW